MLNVAENAMSSQKQIFISHAVKDKPLADSFVDLLETGVGISSNDVFCSSLEGMGITSGNNFVDYVKEQMQEPKAVILLLTQNYYASNFCLCANSHGKCNTDIEQTSRVKSGSLELLKDFKLWSARDVIQPSYHGRTKCHL